ncbi:MAG: hypothetical protein P8X96_25630 [Desulfobacteraceae bacterium]
MEQPQTGIGYWIEPMNFTCHTIQQKVQQYIGNHNDGASYHPQPPQHRPARPYQESASQPIDGDVSDVRMVHMPAMVDEIEIDEVKIRQQAGSQTDPQVAAIRQGGFQPHEL